MEVLMSVKNLVIQDCANWLRSGPSGTQNYCWAHEKSNEGLCLLSGKPPKPCKYFEECVLPLAEDLTEEYSKIKEEEKNGESQGLESADLGSGIGEGTGPSQVIHVPAAPSGLPVGKLIKKAILPRHSLHGVGIEKKTPASRRGIGNR
jgi:hypothetical protein